MYHLGSSEDVLNGESGTWHLVHDAPPHEDSAGYPDVYRNKDFFLSDRDIGASWESLPVDLSEKGYARFAVSARWTIRATGLPDPSSCWPKAILILHELRYSLQANRKTTEGTNHPDRNAQFAHVDTRAKRYLASKDPVISVDTKNKAEFVQQLAHMSGMVGEFELLLDHPRNHRRSSHAIVQSVSHRATVQQVSQLLALLWCQLGRSSGSVSFQQALDTVSLISH